jgi:hypothetical protein
MSGAIVMVLVLCLMGGITVYLVGSLGRSIQHEKRASMKMWKNFGLSLGFCALFLLSWVGRIQPVDATTSTSFSFGFFQPSVWRGRLLRLSATRWSSSSLTFLRLLPFGKY